MGTNEMGNGGKSNEQADLLFKLAVALREGGEHLGGALRVPNVHNLV